MSTALAERQDTELGTIEKVLITGDLKSLTPDQRVEYYMRVCRSVGLNPLTQPFAYIVLNGKLTLYALKGATDQLREMHGVSVTKIDQQRVDDLFVVTVYVQDQHGRTDSDVGVIPIGDAAGEKKANLLMKCVTKAKRRVTLSICGLGMLDETEVETIPNAQRVTEHGEIIEAERPALRADTQEPAGDRSVAASIVEDQKRLAELTGETTGAIAKRAFEETGAPRRPWSKLSDKWLRELGKWFTAELQKAQSEGAVTVEQIDVEEADDAFTV